MVASPAPVPGRCFSSGSPRSSTPSSRSRRTSTAVKVLVIEPIRYCTLASGACPSTEVRAPFHTVSPPRTTAATSDGARPSA